MATDASKAMSPPSPQGSAWLLPRLPALPLAQDHLGLQGLFLIWSLVKILPPALMNPTWHQACHRVALLLPALIGYLLLIPLEIHATTH